MSNNLQEYRCPFTDALLCKAAGNGQIEISHRRLTSYVGPSRKSQDDGPKGVDFQQNCVDLNCKKCKRLMAKAIGYKMLVEIKCRYCAVTTLFDLEKIHAPYVAPLASRQRDEYIRVRTFAD